MSKKGKKKSELPERLKERSTWLGLFSLASMTGLITTAEAISAGNAVSAVIIGVSSLYSIFSKEGEENAQEISQ